MTTDKWWKTSGVLGRTFARKSDLEDEIRRIIYSYPLETPVADPDFRFLIDVLKHHAGWLEKSDGGVVAIKPRAYTAWSGTTTGLVLVIADWSEVDISWVVALKPGGMCSAKVNVAAAARFEIVSQRNAASAAVPDGSPCPLCGEPLLKGNRHVDHAPPYSFDRILTEFVELFAGRFENIALVPYDVTQDQFADRDLADTWRDYHGNFAALRVIHKHENLGSARA